MFTQKKFNDEIEAFTTKYGQRPTVAHLSQRQRAGIYHEDCINRSFEPNRFATPRVSQFNGVEVRECKDDGPHFSVVV